MEKRITMKCWHCRRNYSLLKELDVDERPQFIVACPYCGREGVVDLDPYRSDVVGVFRGPGEDAGKVGAGLNLPEVLPTSPLEE